MSNVKKPILNIDGQIEHLAGKGVKFELTSKVDAIKYLSENNNYFKLTAYRKNFSKYEAGERTGTYIDLDFALLRDLAIIDMRLRYLLLQMTLDVEHFAKVKLLRAIENAGEDGYTIVSDFRESLAKEQLTKLYSEISRNRDNTYCGAIVKKYEPEFPVWAFIEIISFGQFIAFYRFCAERFSSKQLKDDHYLMKPVKSLRNAAAHNNCIINDLSRKSTRSSNYELNRALSRIGLTSKRVQRQMRNERVLQIISLVYFHKQIVGSEGVHIQRAKELQELVSERLFHHIDYYKKNSLICSTFEFLKIVVDNWFQNEYTTRA